MSRRSRWVSISACAILAVLVLVWLVFARASALPPAAIAWRVQPDRFPLGAVLQGSRVEMSVGLFSGLKPAPLPAALANLPSPFRKASQWTVEQYRALAARMGLGVRVEAPPFLEVNQTLVAAHPWQGPFVMILVRLKTDSAGDCRGNLVVHLKGGAYGLTNIIIPLSAKVIGASSSPTQAVLIVETPYEEYATSDGTNFQPLATLNSRLAGQGVRVDYCRQLPVSLATYRTILLGGSELAALGSAEAGRLRKFVTGGGRLILTPNAFFVSTVPNANRLLGSYGLQVVDRDAGLAITNSRVVSDRLTAGVKTVDFWRPSQIDVTDTSHGKLLVESGDGPGGFVAISRAESRGDVVVLTQSLWWSWIRSDPARADNLVLLENLLAH